MDIPQNRFVRHEDVFAQRIVEMQQIFLINERIPQKTFREGFAVWKFMDFSLALDPAFWLALRSSPALQSDEIINVQAIVPDARLYKERFGHFAAFSLSINCDPGLYSACMLYDPGGSPADAVQHIASVICWWGSSRTWGFWGERDLGIVIGGTSGNFSNWLPTLSKAVDSSAMALEQIIALEFRDQIIPPEFVKDFARHYNHVG